MGDQVRFQFEYAQRVRCAFIGAGDHAFRNIYPALHYAPVDLCAVCDLRTGRAETYARMFGAPASYTDHRRMLERERPVAVFVVTSYDSSGRVQATDLALDCLRAGAHVWMEKPTAGSIAGVRRLQAASAESGRIVMTGLKKMFTPAIEKVKALTARPEFGAVSTVAVRYPQALPPPELRSDPLAMLGFLDHIYHPAAVLRYLGGPIVRFCYEWEPATGASVACLRFASGAIGALHLSAGSAESSPIERVEVVGRDANVVVDNGVRITYYRPGANRLYGRSGSYVVEDAVAPLLWEPEFSLGELANKNLFYLGYVPEVVEFCVAVQAGRQPTKGTLADSLAIMQLYEAYRRVPAGATVDLPLDAE